MARTVILGRSGTGKSWFMGYYLEQVIPEFTYAVHYDYEDEERTFSAGDHPLLKTLYVNSELLENLNFAKVIRKFKKIRIVPDGLTNDEQIELVTKLAPILVDEYDEYGISDVHLSIDEAHNIIPEGQVTEPISRLLTGGRKYGVEWAMATQRAQKIDKDSISQADYGIAFAARDRDSKKSADWIGIDEETLKNLPRRKAIVKNFNNSDTNTIDTNTLTRRYPHLDGEEGKADEFINDGLL